MPEPRQNRGAFQIQVSYSFDRLLEPKLAQAYELLVPCREHPVGARVKEFDDEDGGNLRKSVVREATRGEHDREPDGVADRRGREIHCGSFLGCDLRIAKPVAQYDRTDRQLLAVSICLPNFQHRL